MRVAFIGQKGIPARFGGVEHHVDRLSRGLAARHHQVIVYVRPWYSGTAPRSYSGVRLIRIPTLRTKHLDAAVHSFLSSVHCLFTRVQVVHYHGIGPAAFSLIPRLFGRRTVATIHRLDWAAKKWGRLARLLIRLGEWVSVRAAHQTIVVSKDIWNHVRSSYGRNPVLIPNGIPPAFRRPLRTLGKKFGLAPAAYVLFMGRLVPEKRPDMLIRAFLALGPSGPPSRRLKLVLAGGSSATDSYVRELKELAGGNPRVVFTGYVWSEEKEELLSHALLFVLPSNLEGYPISILEAKSYGLCCLASDIAPHREVIRDGRDGRFFRSEDEQDLRASLAALIARPAEIRRLGRGALDDARNRPSWEDVVEQTILSYRAVLGRLG